MSTLLEIPNFLRPSTKKYINSLFFYLKDFLTNLANIRVKSSISDDSQQRALVRGDLGRKVKISSFLRSHLEGVFPGAVDNSADTERGFNNVRSELFFHNSLLLKFKTDHIGGDGESSAVFKGQGPGLVGGQGFRSGLSGVFVEVFEGFDDSLVVSLESFTDDGLSELGFEDFDFLSLGEFSGGNQIFLGEFGVSGQIKSRSVSNTDNFDPTVRSEDFSIPTVLRIMGHFVGQMLSESDTFRSDTTSDQERVSSGDEISQGFVVDDLLSEGFSKGHFNSVTTGGLLDSVVQRQRVVLDGFEFRVGLVFGVNEMFNFGHTEFSKSQQTTSGGNFVSETYTQLCASKRNTTTVIFEEISEVNEDTLGSFRSQITLGVTSRANLDSKHQVEFVRLGKSITSLGALDAEFLDDFFNIVNLVFIDSSQDFFISSSLFRSKLFLLLCLSFFNELIGVRGDSIRIRLLLRLNDQLYSRILSFQYH